MCPERETQKEKEQERRVEGKGGSGGWGVRQEIWKGVKKRAAEGRRRL